MGLKGYLRRKAEKRKAEKRIYQEEYEKTYKKERIAHLQDTARKKAKAKATGKSSFIQHYADELKRGVRVKAKTKKSKRPVKKKQKYVVVGGRAYQVAKQPKRKKRQKHRQGKTRQKPSILDIFGS